MRSYTVYGIKDGVEEYVATVHSPEEGKAVHSQMKADGYYDAIRVKDCLGAVRFEYKLLTVANTRLTLSEVNATV
jgi:hypothetical protein